MIEVVTVPTSNRLIELETVKLKLSLTDSSQDGVLDDLIATANEVIPQHLRRDCLGRAQYHAVISGSGECRLVLPHYPIESVVLLTVNGMTVPEVDITDVDAGQANGFLLSNPKAGIIFWQDGFPVAAQRSYFLSDRPVVGADLPNIDVTWWAGYIMAGDDVEAGQFKLPENITRAAWYCVKEWWLEDQRDDNIVSRSLSSGSRRSEATTDPFVETQIAYQKSTDPPADLPAKAIALLRPFRRTTV